MGSYDTLRDELSRDFTAEDVARLPDYIKKEEEGYGKRQNKTEMALVYFVLMLILVLYSASTFYGISFTLSNEYLLLVAALVFIPIILAAAVRPSKGKSMVIKVGRDQLTKEERLRLYARMEVQVKKARERRGETA